MQYFYDALSEAPRAQFSFSGGYAYAQIIYDLQPSPLPVRVSTLCRRLSLLRYIDSEQFHFCSAVKAHTEGIISDRYNHI